MYGIATYGRMGLIVGGGIVTTFHDYCPVGDLAGNPHKYPVGTGVVVPWDVAGDPRSGVESCRNCYLAATSASEYLRFRGYQNVEEWAADSDYTRTGDTWHDEHGNEIRPYAQLLAALDRELEEYE